MSVIFFLGGLFMIVMAYIETHKLSLFIGLVWVFAAAFVLWRDIVDYREFEKSKTGQK